MSEKKDKFNPSEHLLDLHGKAYLQVMWRLVWFREEHPDWEIRTELIEHKVGEYAVFKAWILKTLEEKGVGIPQQSAHGSETKADFGDYLEKAETKAIGRALAMCGYGTQFAPELDEGERIVDSPVPPPTGVEPAPVAPAPEPPTHEDGAPFTGSGTIKYLEEKPTSSKFKLQTEDALIRVLCWSDHTREAVRGYDSPTLKDSLVTVHGTWSSWTNDAGAVFWSVKAEDINPNLPF